jgi:hypothetical protein
MRPLIALAVVAGCSFSPHGTPSDGNGGPNGDGQ